jgi:S-adenosylmethionine:tRNA ribosyltransferase-isomerase
VRRTGGEIPGLFLRESTTGYWHVLLAGGGRLRDGETLELRGGAWTLTLVERLERGECIVRVDPPHQPAQVLAAVGSMPVPPYIRRDDDDPELERIDREHYQTIYALREGSVAAPTAGLHFTPGLMARVRARGARFAELVLHVGVGTFQPIEVQDLAEHKMHHEWYELSPKCAEAIAGTRATGGRVIAVGTTSVRVLETCADATAVQAGSGTTNLLIYPPYRFKVTDALITNFHLPESTLLALVFAFAGREATLAAYQEAIARRYRFFSYGDAMLVL